MRALFCGAAICAAAICEGVRWRGLMRGHCRDDFLRGAYRVGGGMVTRKNGGGGYVGGAAWSVAYMSAARPCPHVLMSLCSHCSMSLCPHCELLALQLMRSPHHVYICGLMCPCPHCSTLRAPRLHLAPLHGSTCSRIYRCIRAYALVCIYTVLFCLRRYLMHI